VQTIRAYTKLFPRHFSTEATPATGQSRRFTIDDLRLIHYAYQQTQMGFTREHVAQALADGALAAYDWQPAPPSAAAPEATEPESEPSSALVPLERLQAARLLLEDAQQREQKAVEQLAAAQKEIVDLQLQLGEAKGELQGFRAAQYRAPIWWRRIFGGRAGE
jgi:DNA-binding transcriptional MerR regulator